MNLIQKNPNDPKYNEFHDGEYEYWPMDDSIKGKSISFPASLVSGLELLAAAAAAALLALALSVLYVLSSPRMIRENSARINVNTYNAAEGQQIVYTLSLKAKPEDVLQEGLLEDEKDTLDLYGLTGGTTYLLQYYDAGSSGLEPVGKFEFTTPGTPPEPEHGDPSAPVPSPTEPDVGPEPTFETEVPETTQPETEPAEVTSEPTEAPTEPPGNIYYPPTPLPDPITPEPEPEPDTEPTEPDTEPTEPDTEPDTEPTEPEETIPVTVIEPDIGNVSSISPESGDEYEIYYQYEEYHTFQNIPDGGYTISIRQGNAEITDYTAELSDDGTLSVSFLGEPVPNGKEVTTTVTVTYSGGSATSTNTVKMPSLESAEVTVTKNADGTHTFTVTADVDSDGTQTMTCEARLYRTYADEGITLPMAEESLERHSVSHTTEIESTEEEEEAFVVVSAYWSLADGSYVQIAYHYCYYTP